MSTTSDPSTLEQTRALLRDIVEEERLMDEPVSVWVKPLTPQEAIGKPERQDFPIITGKERMIEANVLGARGHAFTDSPQALSGTIAQVLELDLDTNQRRAVFVATLNAVLRHLDRVTGTVHCRDEDPEQCAQELAGLLRERFGQVEVGLVGLNPAIAERLADSFGADHTRITDLNRENIGTRRFGVEIWDGSARTEELVDVSDVLVVTGTTLVNGTFDAIQRRARAANKHFIPYGVTAAGVCELMGIERICPRGRDE